MIVIDEVELAEIALDVVLDKHRLHNLLGREAVNLIRKRASHAWALYKSQNKESAPGRWQWRA